MILFLCYSCGVNSALLLHLIMIFRAIIFIVINYSFRPWCERAFRVKKDLYALKQEIRDLFLIFQIPVINIQAKIIPALFTLLGAIFSCTNYFRVIFTGGMGKNGSTIAVS